MGLLKRFVNALMVEETLDVRQQNPADVCRVCVHWIAPDALTAKIVPSERAIEWARKGGYGRCQAPRPPANDKGDSKRFTLPTAWCQGYKKR